MSKLADHVVTMRQRVCPRTSYATSGSAASTICCVVEDSFASAFAPIADLLKRSGEFETTIERSTIKEITSYVKGNVVLLFGFPVSVLDEAVATFLAEGRTKLIIHVERQPPSSSAQCGTALEYSRLSATIDGSVVLTCFNYRKVASASAALKGFNGQPAAQTGTQFKYLWSPSTPQVEEGKDRVLQRLADKTLHTGDKLTAAQWDGVIRAALQSGLDDYGIYSLIREKTLGTSLAHDLEAQVLYGSSSVKRPGAETETTGGDGGEESDGRANHLVSRTLESVPAALRVPLQAGQRPRRYLDYGCAEGAITAALGRQLGLPADCVFGADVRAIPSVGFTFVQLPAEGDAPPPMGTILPGIADQSIDLITSAMVFHHVTHPKAALLELRRVVSPAGALVIREHHCTSADMGAFLDVTHGLYSLSWSAPVEWPDFIPEYKAFYRSREQWDALIREAGFALAVEEVGPQAVKNYRSAEFARRKANGYFPNVIKGYYAVYRPIPGFRLPERAPLSGRVAAQGSTVQATEDRDLKRPAAGTSASVASAATSGVKRQREEGEGRPDTTMAGSNAGSTAGTGVQTERRGGGERGDGDQGEVFESSKYPGQFYRVNKHTGATEWVQRGLL